MKGNFITPRWELKQKRLTEKNIATSFRTLGRNGVLELQLEELIYYCSCSGGDLVVIVIELIVL